jgi:CBS domain-containing protein
MNVGEFCNRDVVICSKDTPLLEVAQLMRDQHVGSVVITAEIQQKNIPLGIITDRDIVLEINATELDIKQYSAGDVMANEIITANLNDDLWGVIRLMRQKGIRRMPVVDDANTLQGIISFDDLLEALVEEFGDLVQLIAREQKREITNRTTH